LTNCNTTKPLTRESLNDLQPLAETKKIVTSLASDEMQGRNVGTPGIEKAAVYIEKYFIEKGVQPFFGTSYRHSIEAKGVKTDNVIGVIKGTDKNLQNEYILVGAHYDHLGVIDNSEDSVYNGANDNASGVTGAMQIGASLAKFRPKRSVIIALFSAEEKGIIGSKKLADELSEKGISLKCVVNIEMIGKTLSDAPGQVYMTGFKKSNMAERMNSFEEGNFVKFLETETRYALFYRSDNYPFFKILNIPAHTFSTFDFTNYKYYHHTEDEIAQLDMANMNTVIRKLSFAVISLANEETIGVKLNE
jgi:Zn-dependent M28 family amino/carboxypeptidase